MKDNVQSDIDNLLDEDNYYTYRGIAGEVIGIKLSFDEVELLKKSLLTIITKAEQEAIDKIIRYNYNNGFELKFNGSDPILDKIPIKRTSHGNYCTCQICGYFYEDCVCEHNNAIDFIDKEFPRVLAQLKSNKGDK